MVLVVSYHLYIFSFLHIFLTLHSFTFLNPGLFWVPFHSVSLFFHISRSRIVFFQLYSLAYLYISSSRIVLGFLSFIIILLSSYFVIKDCFRFPFMYIPSPFFIFRDQRIVLGFLSCIFRLLSSYFEFKGLF